MGLSMDDIDPDPILLVASCFCQTLALFTEAENVS